LATEKGLASMWVVSKDSPRWGGKNWAHHATLRTPAIKHKKKKLLIGTNALSKNRRPCLLVPIAQGVLPPPRRYYTQKPNIGGGGGEAREFFFKVKSAVVPRLRIRGIYLKTQVREHRLAWRPR